MSVRTATIVAAALTVVCTAVLTADYVVARRNLPRDDERIASLQQQVRSDASLAPALEAEHKRITDARVARKRRINLLSMALIAAAAGFLTGAKRLVGAAVQRPGKLGDSQPIPKTGIGGSPRFAPRGPAPPDLTFVDELVAREGRGREAAIPILQAIQAHYRYLPDEALRRVCELTEITPAEIAGTSSFYARFRRSPVGRHVVRVCHGTACHVSGARQISDELRRRLQIPDGADTDSERMFTLEEVACLGCCSLAPVLMVDEHTVGKLTPAGARDALDMVEPREPA